MKRRTFLKYSALASLISRSKVLAGILSSDETITFNFINRKNESNKIIGFRRNDIDYISANDLASQLCESDLGDRYLFVEENEKLVIVKNKERLILSPNNSFVKLNENIYQMPIPSILKGSIIFVPIIEFAHIITRFSSIKLYLNEGTRTLSLEDKGFSLTGMEIENRINGALLRIVSNKVVKKEYVKSAVKSDANKLYITIYDGKIHTEAFNNYLVTGIIKKIEAIQLGQTSEIVLTLKGKIDKERVSITTDESSFDILVSISTLLTDNEKEELEKDLKKEEEKKNEKDDKLKRFLVDTIIIDAGHGGKDPGAVGKLSKSIKVYEKEVVLDIAHKIKTIINKSHPDIQVFLTRDRDEFIGLKERGKIANKHKGKLFVSLHCNANKNNKAHGFETYIMGDHKDEAAKKTALFENQVIEYEDSENKNYFKDMKNQIIANLNLSGFKKQSIYLAERIDNKIGTNLRTLNIPNRGVKQAGFFVLFGPSMPSVLIELGFISNSYEVKVLANKNDRSRFAQSISTAILDYKRDIDATVT